jgi:hypothetical protein
LILLSSWLWCSIKTVLGYRSLKLTSFLKSLRPKVLI